MTKITARNQPSSRKSKTAKRTRPSARRSVRHAVPQSILVGIDFSKGSLMALDYATTLARALGGTLTLVYVIPPGLDPPDIGFVPGELAAIEQRSRRNAEKRLAALAKKISAPLRGTALVRQGQPSEMLASAVRELGSDLLVIATHGRTGLDRLLLGSTAEKVMRRAPCPVLVVRAPERRAGKVRRPRSVLPIAPIMP